MSPPDSRNSDDTIYTVLLLLSCLFMALGLVFVQWELYQYYGKILGF
jgi:hypothetical protein